MSKPNTLHDLHIDGQFSLRDLEAVARNVFNGNTEIDLADSDPDTPKGYILHIPAYDDLPGHIQAFIRKAFLSCKIENILEKAGFDENDVEVIDDPDADLDED